MVAFELLTCPQIVALCPNMIVYILLLVSLLSRVLPPQLFLVFHNLCFIIVFIVLLIKIIYHHSLYKQVDQVLPLNIKMFFLSSKQSFSSSPSTFCRQYIIPLCTVPCWFQKPSAIGGFFWFTYLIQYSLSYLLSMFNVYVRQRTKLMREFSLPASQLQPPKMKI